MAVAKTTTPTKDKQLLQKARDMVEADVDYRTFSNTFFGPDSELLVGKTRDERAQLVAGSLYKQLKAMAMELGVSQGYLVRDKDSGETQERPYSGTFVMRIPSSLHRKLVVEARREGVSLNQLCTAKLARSLAE